MTWLFNRVVTIQNDSGGTLTDYQCRLRLNNNNFDFNKANNDGSDVRFKNSDGDTDLDYWIEEWSASGALIWVKVPSLEVGSSSINMYYGSPDANTTANGSVVFEYFNELSTTADRDDLSSTFGTATWTVVADGTSPTGSGVNCAVSSTDVGRYKTITLPENHVVEMHVSQRTSSAGGSWEGPLLNMSDINNWYRPGTTDTNTEFTQIRENLATVFTNRDQRQIVTGAEVADDTFYKQMSFWKPLKVVTSDSNFSVGLVTQGCCTDGTYIYETQSGSITRYTMAGAVDETYSTTPTGTSWGDCVIKDGVLYVVWFDSTTATAIYSLDPADLASGHTLEATLTSDMDTGGNALVWTGTYWLVGETDTSSTNIHVYVYDASWNLQKTIIVPRVDTALGFGLQSFEKRGDLIYGMFHEDRCCVYVWSDETLTLDFVDVFDTGWGEPQGIAWDSTNSRWYFTERDNDALHFVTLSEHATTKTAAVAYIDDALSVCVSMWDVASPNTQSLFGISSFRDCRFARLFVRQYIDIEPLLTLGAQTNNTGRINVSQRLHHKANKSFTPIGYYRLGRVYPRNRSREYLMDNHRRRLLSVSEPPTTAETLTIILSLVNEHLLYTEGGGDTGAEHILKLSGGGETGIEHNIKINDNVIGVTIEHLQSINTTPDIILEHLINLSGESNVSLEHILSMSDNIVSLAVEHILSTSNDSKIALEHLVGIANRTDTTVEHLIGLANNTSVTIEHLLSLSNQAVLTLEHLLSLSNDVLIGVETRLSSDAVLAFYNLAIENLLGIKNEGSPTLEHLRKLDNDARTDIEYLRGDESVVRATVEHLRNINNNYDTTLEHLVGLTNQTDIVIEHLLSLSNQAISTLEHLLSLSNDGLVGIETRLSSDAFLAFYNLTVEYLLNIQNEGRPTLEHIVKLSGDSKTAIEHLRKLDNETRTDIEHLGSDENVVRTTVEHLQNITNDYDTTLEHLISLSSENSITLENLIGIGDAKFNADIEHILSLSNAYNTAIEHRLLGAAAFLYSLGIEHLSTIENIGDIGTEHLVSLDNVRGTTVEHLLQAAAHVSNVTIEHLLSLANIGKVGVEHILPGILTIINNVAIENLVGVINDNDITLEHLLGLVGINFDIGSEQLIKLDAPVVNILSEHLSSVENTRLLSAEILQNILLAPDVAIEYLVSAGIDLPIAVEHILSIQNEGAVGIEHELIPLITVIEKVGIEHLLAPTIFGSPSTFTWILDTRNAIWILRERI